MSKTDEAIGRLTAQVELLHEDLKEMRDDVQSLKDDMSKRTVIYKIGYWVLTLCGPIISYFMMKFIK